jgi:hypothetical protein
LSPTAPAPVPDGQDLRRQFWLLTLGNNDSINARLLDQFASAFGTDRRARRNRAVSAAGYRSACGQVRAGSRELDHEGLHRSAALLYLDAIIQVQLERIGGDSQVAQAQHVDLAGELGVFLL